MRRASRGAYVIVDISEVTNQDVLKTLLPKAPGAVQAFKGQFVVRTDKITALDGTAPKRFVVISFKIFAQAHPQMIDVVLGAARDVYAEAAKDIPGTVKTFSAAAGFPEPVMEVALSRRSFGILPISSPVTAEQQRIADTFKELGLIPAAIKVSDAVHKSGS